MNRKRAIIIASVLAILAMAGLVYALASVPKLVGRVNDYANTLDGRQRSQIEQVLAQYEAETTNQIAVLTVPSLEGEAIEQFSIRVVEAWKLGQKGKDNGVLLLVAPNERKVRIEVGYGLEGAITDLEASRIIRNVIVPAFKTGNYYVGIVGGLDGIVKAAGGEFIAEKRHVNYEGNEKKSIVSTIVSIIILILLLSTRTGRMILFTMLIFGGRGGRGGGFGGGFSGGGGGFGGGGASGSW